MTVGMVHNLDAVSHVPGSSRHSLLSLSLNQWQAAAGICSNILCLPTGRKEKEEKEGEQANKQTGS